MTLVMGFLLHAWERSVTFLAPSYALVMDLWRVNQRMEAFLSACPGFFVSCIYRQEKALLMDGQTAPEFS